MGAAGAGAAVHRALVAVIAVERLVDASSSRAEVHRARIPIGTGRDREGASGTERDARSAALRLVILIGLTTAVVVDPVAARIVRGRRPGRAGARLNLSTDACVRNRSRARSDSTVRAGRDLREPVVGDAVAILVDSIAVAIIAGRGTRRAARRLLAVDARAHSRDRADAEPAGGRVGGVVVVGDAIAVVVDAVARDVVVREHLTGYAGVDHLTLDAHRLAGAVEWWLATRGRRSDEVFVQATVTILVDAVAGGSVPHAGQPGHAAVDQLTAAAGAEARARAGANPAERLSRREVLVRVAVAVLVRVAATVDIRLGLGRHAGVLDRTCHAQRDPGRGAVARAALRLERDVVLVEQVAARIVEPLVAGDADIDRLTQYALHAAD